MLGSHCILFHAPVVVNEKVYTPPALVMLFHDANIFTQISTVLWKIVQVWPQKLQFDWHSCPELAETFQWLSNFLLVYCTLVISQEVCNYLLQWLGSSTSLSASTNIGSFMSSLIWKPSYIPALSFSMLIHGNFSWKNANLLPSLSIAFTKFFITPNLICKGGTVFCLVQQ